MRWFLVNQTSVKGQAPARGGHKGGEKGGGFKTPAWSQMSLNLNHGFVRSWLCGLGQATWPLYASVSSFEK